MTLGIFSTGDIEISGTSETPTQTPKYARNALKTCFPRTGDAHMMTTRYSKVIEWRVESGEHVKSTASEMCQLGN